MILMKNSFSFNERVKTSLLCKLLPSLDYPYTLDYKEVLLTTLSTSYADYQKCVLCKLFARILLAILRKIILTLTAKKILNSTENSRFWESSQLLEKFSA